MLYSIAETRATPVSSLVEPLPLIPAHLTARSLLLNSMVACALLTRTLLYMQYCAVQTSPKHDIPACQSVPGWDGMGWDASFRTVLRTRTAQATCYLHLPTCTWDAVQYTRMYMQQRASVEFCWASPPAMPCHSPHPAHPIGISEYPSPIVRPQFCSLVLFITVLLLVYTVANREEKRRTGE